MEKPRLYSGISMTSHGSGGRPTRSCARTKSVASSRRRFASGTMVASSRWSSASLSSTARMARLLLGVGRGLRRRAGHERRPELHRGREHARLRLAHEDARVLLEGVGVDAGVVELEAEGLREARRAPARKEPSLRGRRSSLEEGRRSRAATEERAAAPPRARPCCAGTLAKSSGRSVLAESDEPFGLLDRRLGVHSRRVRQPLLRDGDDRGDAVAAALRGSSCALRGARSPASRAGRARRRSGSRRTAALPLRFARPRCRTGGCRAGWPGSRRRCGHLRRGLRAGRTTARRGWHRRTGSSRRPLRRSRLATRRRTSDRRGRSRSSESARDSRAESAR